MSPFNGNAESRERYAPADRQLKQLALRCFKLSRQLRQVRDQHAGSIPIDDYHFSTLLSVELTAYSAILQMNPKRRVEWLKHTIALSEKTILRLSKPKGGVS